MDAQLRSLSTDLINLRENFLFDPKDDILKELKKVKKSSNGAKTKTQSSEDSPPQWKKTYKQVKHSVSKFLGFDLIGVWGFILFVTIAIWIQIYRKHGFKAKDWMPDWKEACLMETNLIQQEVARPAFDCKVCSQLKTIPVVENMTRETFLEKYAYSKVPVVVRGAVKNWTAVQTFSFQFFKDLYTKVKGSLKDHEDSGQFFAYKSGFKNLKEALMMSRLRKKKPFYFGWNNDHPEVAKILRQHYQRPYFLPPDSESSKTDWIFMGWGGGGAHIHLDYVSRPSWQAQIKGTKTWLLEPSPECMSVCSNINATVTPGDIIVVDTNFWYHGTKALSNVSITIGSEYD